MEVNIDYHGIECVNCECARQFSHTHKSLFRTFEEVKKFYDQVYPPHITQVDFEKLCEQLEQAKQQLELLMKS